MNAVAGCAAPRRNFRGRRWLSVALRGLHLAAVIWLGASILGAPIHASDAPGWAVLSTGLALWALDIWSKPEHLREWAGFSMILKLVLVGAMVALPATRDALFWVVVLWSAAFSHAPASFRNARVFGP